MSVVPLLLFVYLSASLLSLACTKVAPTIPFLNKLRKREEKVDLLQPIEGSGSGFSPTDSCSYDQIFAQLQTFSFNCAKDVAFENCCQIKFLFSKPLAVPIYPLRSYQGVNVFYCDMETMGGGWMLIYRGGTGNRAAGVFHGIKMRAYENGYGKLQKDFWLGLEHVHHFTNNAKGGTELLVELVRNGTKFFAHYKKFSVGSKAAGYRLAVGGYSKESTLPDSLSHNNGFKFSVYYQPPNIEQYNSPPYRRGYPYYSDCNTIFIDAWWHGSKGNESCTKVSLLRDYNIGFDSRFSRLPGGLLWEVDGKKTSFQYGELKIRPRNWECGKRPYPNHVLQRAFLTARYPDLNPFREDGDIN